MNVSVIFTTYNSINWLKKVLVGFEQQSYKKFNIIIADDGSTNETKSFIEAFKLNSQLNIEHVWQPDNGFQKSKILNKAVHHSSSDYLIFTDGDCIPRHDFVETHVKHAKKGYFLSGGYIKLAQSTSEIISIEDIVSQSCFNRKWLIKMGTKNSFKLSKLSTNTFFCKVMQAVTPTKATWNGHNSSGWREDILKTNGFDERMQYGGQDRELGERLLNLGIKSIQIRYSAICIHLEHKRAYAQPRSIEVNKAIRSQTRKRKSTYTKHGIFKGSKR
jgi:glycosyltransferase involved in cell wall biosynthesis